ncbi:MAG: S1C family serine protease [Acidimicrobiales bacterium]
MEHDDGLEDDGPLFAWLPPEDRLWRHPSEVPPPAVGPSPPRPREQMPPLTTWRRNAVARTWSVAVVAGVVGALVASSVGVVAGTFERHTTVVQSVARFAPADTAALSTTSPGTNWSRVVDTVSPSIVGLNVTTPSGQVSGSGVLFAGGAGRAYVMTDARLVDERGPITTTFSDGAVSVGHLMAVDAVTGIAVLWANGGNQAYPTMGTIADLRAQEAVLAVGARSEPGVAYPATVIALDQHIVTTAGGTLDGLIELDSPALPQTETGGALVDPSGTVVGINVTVNPADPVEQPFSFAVPIDEAVHVTRQVLARQSITHPWLGVSDDSDLSSVTAKQLGISGGAQVGAVAPGSPAARAGIAPLDVITAFDGQHVTTTGILTELVDRCSPNQRTTITYVHHGRTSTKPIKVGNLASSAVTGP